MGRVKEEGKDKYRYSENVGKFENIGGDGCGWVYKGYDFVNNQAIAVKKFYVPTKENEGVLRTISRETSLLKEMEHKNITRLLNVRNEEGGVYLVFESMDLDLKKFMETNPATAKDSRVVKWVLHQILCGVTYYHSHEVLLRDLKPQNLLIDLSKNVLKITGFGSAREIDSPLMKYTPEVETPWYKAPEFFLGSLQYSTATDVWSVGCIFAEMVIQQPLFPGQNALYVLWEMFSIMGTPNEETWPGVTSLCEDICDFVKIDAKNLMEVVPDLEPAGIDLLSKMLCMNPRDRITAPEALNHEYFKDVETITVFPPIAA